MIPRMEAPELMTRNPELFRCIAEIFDLIAEQGIDVALISHGPRAEGGWSAEACRADFSERWLVWSMCACEAARELAHQIGLMRS